jgi:hypothetical protein
VVILSFLRRLKTKLDVKKKSTKFSIVELQDFFWEFHSR